MRFSFVHSCRRYCSRPLPWRGGRMGMEIARSATATLGCCSKEHQRIYADWFSLTDSDGDDRVTGANLKQVWVLADSKLQGYLIFGEFAAMMQLVSLVQAGNEITQDSLKCEDLSSLDPPVMKGLDELLVRSKAIADAVRPQENGRNANYDIIGPAS